jgi:hypothetical protein
VMSAVTTASKSSRTPTLPQNLSSTSTILCG